MSYVTITKNKDYSKYFSILILLICQWCFIKNTVGKKEEIKKENNSVVIYCVTK